MRAHYSLPLTFGHVIAHNPADTICAIATPSGKGALGIIRISGPEALRVVLACTGPARTQLRARRATLARWHYQGRLLDEVLLTYFAAPASYTGEDLVEVGCHGSPYILAQLMRSLVDAGCRTAAPGEFSMRAFAHGKMDLSQAEAIADLIASQSAAAHRLAMNQMRGGFSKKINQLRQSLIDFAALIELELDFSEEDLTFADRNALEKLLLELLRELERLLQSFSGGQALREGIPTVLLGAPNTGKSTLLNALLKEERAIVSDIAGTTRDTIEDELYLGDYRFRITDTAGLRHTADRIEHMGISRSYAAAGKAAIVLLLFDLHSQQPAAVPETLARIRPQIPPTAHLLCVGTKVDLLAKPPTGWPADLLVLSARSGEGMEALLARLQSIAAGMAGEGQEVVLSNSRHYEAISRAHRALLQAKASLHSGHSGELLATHIREALHHMGLITGSISTDDLLGSIFSRFCIGK